MATNIVDAEAWCLEQHVLANEQACLLLADFCAAFPSLAIPWLLHVLREMGICPAVVAFFCIAVPGAVCH
eukprot:5921883-Pyramimonas_sp.AAC.1